ncbi:hypothetical protein FQR65_LT12347 [Abscondita terminalis]|nr:hypothetical protein FQR65_LT12347 [Abscondita terminalis]
MSCGSLPPVPGLIPISALRKSPSCNNNDLRECTPCAVQKEVMGEQRPRRTGSQPSVDLIDIARRSRGSTDIPQAPSGKARAERHRKSDRRRERRGGRKRSASKREKSVNPRVNPIFVWIRQEDTHIVDVKCEDYDKRNRIVLTKTAQGWRAIPRTETLVPNLKAAAAAPSANSDEETFKQQQHHRKVRKSNRVKRKSTAVQVDEDEDAAALTEDSKGSTWSAAPINVESHLPSHTIKVQRKRSPSPEDIPTADDATENVNTSVEHSYIAQAPIVECSASKVCDVSPLENLLAVAELEFNQQIQTEAWQEEASEKSIQQNNAPSEQFESECEKDDDCDYNEEDENNLAMDDILNRLEQSLQSPDTLGTDLVEESNEEDKHSNITEVPDIIPTPTESKDELVCSTIADDKPTDLTTKKTECLTITLPDDDLMPTDLSVPKKRSPSLSPRPSSRCSETIQSPQPSGLPAVPHSPDVQTGTKTAYLESLLSSTSHKIPLNSEVTITRQSEPLDFGKCRKSASPTVTCSEEINSTSVSKEGEPETKKGKVDDITLRNILDAATLQNREEDGKTPRVTKSESSRLLELLTSEAEPDALAQLKQLHADPVLNLPDPMLVPKDRLSQILLSPGKEIPKLLGERPELRLPEALAFPHLLQDPDILVITISQLETIIKKQTNINLPSEKQSAKSKKPNVEVAKSEKTKHPKPAPVAKETPRASELCNDPNLTNMMWLPYLHQLELAAMAFGNGADFLKMIGSFPPYSNQTPDISQMFPLNRFSHPTSFPMPPLPNSNNPFEFPIWHENAQANFPRPNHYERLCNNNNNNNNKYRDYVDKTKNHKFLNQKPQYPPAVYQQTPPHHAISPHQFMNVPTPYQSSNPRVNLHIPQYNTILTQKNPMYNNKNEKPSPAPADVKVGNLYRERYESAKNLNNQRYNHKTCNQKAKVDNSKKTSDFVTQPMDLSGSTTNKSKYGGKQNFPDSVSMKSLKFDDIPEVGSTTASIEDIHMQESQKHLWHPLFGNRNVAHKVSFVTQQKRNSADVGWLFQIHEIV